MRSLRDPWTLGGLTIPNRVVLAPLAGIGNWFVRLQAKRYGAGLAVSEMVSSFAVHYGNPKTLQRAAAHRPERARGRAGLRAAVRPRPRDHALRGGDRRARRRRHHRPQHGLPRAQGLQDRRGRRDARRPRHSPWRSRSPRARAPGSRSRSSCAPAASRGRREGVDVARRLVEEAGVAGLSFHPRSAAVQPQGRARLRPRRRARRLGARPGDRLGRHGRPGPHPLGARAHRRGGGHARPRIARQPVAVRRSCSATTSARPRARRCSTSSTGWSIARSSTWARSAPRATCASSIPWYLARLAAPRLHAGRAAMRGGS